MKKAILFIVLLSISGLLWYARTTETFGAGIKISELPTDTSLESTDYLVSVDSTPSTKKTTLATVADAVFDYISGLGNYVLALGTGSTVGGEDICLADGTNCQSEADTLATVTARGATTSDAVTLNGGATVSALTVSGLSTLATATMTSGTSTDFYSTLGRFSAVTSTEIRANTATFGIATVSGQSLCLEDGTDCPTVAGTSTWYGPIGMSMATFTSATGTDLFSTTIRGTNGVFATDVLIGGQSTCLEDGTNCPASGASSDTLLAVTNRGGVATSSLFFFGGATTSNLTATGTTSLQGVSFTSATGTSLFVTSGGFDSLNTNGFVAGTSTVGGTTLVTKNGKVGIGTATPSRELEIVGDLAVGRIYGSGSWNTSGSITGTGFWSNTYLHTGSYIESGSDIYTLGSGDDFWLGNYTQGSASFRAYANGDLYAGGSATTTNLDVTTRLGFADATGTSLFVTSGGFGSLYTTGLSAFGDTTFTHATGTSITGTLGHFDSICLSGDCQSAWPSGSTTSTWYGNIELANATTTNLYFGTATGSSLFANTAVFGALTVGGQSVCLANGTNCPTASIAEVNAGTDTAKSVTSDALAGSYAGTKTVEMYLTTSTGALLAINGASNTSTCFVVPPSMGGMNLVVASSSHGEIGTGAYAMIQVRNQTQGADMLSTAIHIDGGEKNSWDAVTSTVIDASNDDVASGDRVCADVDQVETTPGKETILFLGFRLP